MEASIDDLRFCAWNHTRQVCTADSVAILNSVNLTSSAESLVPGITDMLACPLHPDHSTECSANKFCQVDVNGTCRTSSGTETLRFIYSSARSVIQMCGWIGALFDGHVCPSYSLSECTQAGCAVSAQLIQNSSGSCALGPACNDDLPSYLMRLCTGVPSFDVGQIMGCLQLPGTSQIINCTRAVCPQFALRLEFELVDPCVGHTSRNDCMTDNRCLLGTEGVCEQDLFGKIRGLSPPGCRLSEGMAWTYHRCMSARTPELCRSLGRECLWQEASVCASEGPATGMSVCGGAPEMVGLYLRPPSNVTGSGGVTPTIDLLSKTIVSAHTCPYFEMQQCLPPESPSAGTGWTDGLAMEVIILMVVLGALLVLSSVALAAYWHRRRITRRKKEAAAAAGLPGRSQEHASECSSAGFDTVGSSSQDFATSDPTTILSRGISEHWFLPVDSLKLKPEVIGSGGFGEVSRGTLFGITQVAVKQPHEDNRRILINPSLINEIRVLRRIRHPNVVLFHGLTVITPAGKPPSVGIVLEWVSGGNLQQFVKRRTKSGCFQKNCKEWQASGGVNLIQEVKLLQDVARGLGYLHAQSPPILHRDVKPANILIESHLPPLAKLADLGLSILENGRKKNRAGTRSYMAPEVVQRKDYGLPADIYSFGCIMLFIGDVADITPGSEKSWLLPPCLFTLTQQCLAEDPRRRPLSGSIYTQLDCTTASSTATGSAAGSSPLSPPDESHKLSL